MAGRAVIHDTGMVKGGAGKIGGVMTDAAILAGGNMRRRLTSGSQFFMCPIMAGRTITGDVVVTENRGRECRIAVAEMAILIRWQMVCCRLFGRGESTVVTTFAAGGDVRVSRRQEG